MGESEAAHFGSVLSEEAEKSFGTQARSREASGSQLCSILLAAAVRFSKQAGSGPWVAAAYVEVKLVLRRRRARRACGPPPIMNGGDVAKVALVQRFVGPKGVEPAGRGKVAKLK